MGAGQALQTYLFYLPHQGLQRLSWIIKDGNNSKELKGKSGQLEAVHKIGLPHIPAESNRVSTLHNGSLEGVSHC